MFQHSALLIFAVLVTCSTLTRSFQPAKIPIKFHSDVRNRLILANSQHQNIVTAQLMTTTTTAARLNNTGAQSTSLRAGGVEFKHESIYEDLESMRKHTIVYVPGLDGVGDYSLPSIRNLSVAYDVWRFEFDPNDRSSFVQLSNNVIELLGKQFTTPIILMGESFGGLLAAYIALRIKSRLSSLILVNPATSYTSTSWPTLGPLIASTGAAFPVVGIATLLSTAVELPQIVKFVQSVSSQINSTESAVELFNKLLASGQRVTELLPPETVKHRLNEWLDCGNTIVNSRLQSLQVPTLIITGGSDRMLPSSLEGKRLKQVINNTTVELLEYPTSGHAILDGTVNLLQVLNNSAVIPKVNTTIRVFSNQSINSVSSSTVVSHDGIPPNKVVAKSEMNADRKVETQDDLDIEMPTKEEIEKVNKQFNFMRQSISPIFLSRGPDNFVRRGLYHVPTGTSSDRPVLLVGNHQLYGADLYFLISEFLNSKQTLIRGLAHPAVMDIFGEPDNVMRRRGISPPGVGVSGPSEVRNVFKKFGAVKVSPSSYYGLLKRKETILLFPGGVKEAYHKKGEEYQLFWPEKIDFVRMAAMFDALIVPFAAIGMADSVNMIFDGDEILEMPFFGEQAKKISDATPQARPNGDDQFIAPLSVPKLPARNYFLFQQPYDTRSLSLSDKTSCKLAYQEIRQRVTDGIQTLKKFRDSDPYSDPVKRLLYERIAGDQAPTADLNRRW